MEVRGLWKRYGPVVALRGIGFSVPRGTVVGFVGPNGAGKTTTIKCVMGLVWCERGEVSVDGLDWRSREARRLLAYAPELPEAPGWATVCGLLEYLARVEGLSAVEARREARRAAEAVGLAEYCGRRVGSLSKGMRKRLLIAQALVPPGKGYYLFDEPFTGLDPEWIRAVRETVVGLAREGAGVLVSSHILRELEEIAGRVVIVYRGRVLFEGGIEELASMAGGGRYLVLRTGTPGEAVRVLEGMGLRPVLVSSNTLRVELAGTGAEEVIQALERSGIRIVSYEVRTASLEDAYLDIIRREAERGAR